MILDDYVWVTLNGSNIKYYELLGYSIPRSSANDGHKKRLTVKRGTKILVHIDDLQKSSKAKVNVQCDYCGEHFVREYQLVINGRNGKTSKDACKKCSGPKSGESRKMDFNDVARAFEARGYILLTAKEDIRFLNTDKLKYLCPIHGEKFTTWNRFSTKGSGCDECAVESNKIALKKHAWQRILEMFNNSEYELLSSFDEYTSSVDHCIRALCKKHGEFKTSWANFQRHCGCPMCNSSMGERSIAWYLDANNIAYDKPKKFDGLVGLGGRKLSYDFYLPDYNLLIEYQGKQHESPGHFSDMPDDKAIQEFAKQQEHDKRKRNYANNNGYKLLEIWYYDFNNIDSILQKHLTIQN